MFKYFKEDLPVIIIESLKWGAYGAAILLLITIPILIFGPKSYYAYNNELGKNEYDSVCVYIDSLYTYKKCIGGGTVVYKISSVNDSIMFVYTKNTDAINILGVNKLYIDKKKLFEESKHPKKRTFDAF